MARTKEELAQIPFRMLCPSQIEYAQWAEIIDSWKNGLSDREAAFRASSKTGHFLSEATLREAVQSDEDIGALRDSLHSELLQQAKLNIADSIRNGNVSTTKWFLERKAPDEFSSKAAIAFEGAVTEISLSDKKAQMEAFMEQFGTKKDNSVLEIGAIPKSIKDKPEDETDE